MPAPLIGLGLALAAEFLPTAVRWLSGSDNAEAVAETVVAIARTATGETDDARLLESLRANPEAVIAVQRAWLAHETALYAEETKRLEAVNATIRAEAASGDAYVRRMRPTFGYVMAATWGAMMAAIAWTVVTAPNDAATVITAFASMSTIWSVGLAVLGVYVYKRSDEKTGKAAQPGLIAALSRRLGGGKSG